MSRAEVRLSRRTLDAVDDLAQAADVSRDEAVWAAVSAVRRAGGRADRLGLTPRALAREYVEVHDLFHRTLAQSLRISAALHARGETLQSLGVAPGSVFRTVDVAEAEWLHGRFYTWVPAEERLRRRLGEAVREADTTSDGGERERRPARRARARRARPPAAGAQPQPGRPNRAQGPA